MKSGKEERIILSSGELALEGLLSRGESDRGLVISHPHPLYGGEMRNHVVGIIQEIFSGKGWTTLRFNFRGVGRSQGEYDEGVGEREDVGAAIRYLKELGIKEIVLAGYSFGAWVNARAALDHPDVDRIHTGSSAPGYDGLFLPQGRQQDPAGHCRRKGRLRTG